MRKYRGLLVLLVWMTALVSVFGYTNLPDITTTTTTSASSMNMKLLQRIRSYMFSTMDKITRPMRPICQGMTRVFRSLHPLEFQMYMISLRAVNHTNTPTSFPTLAAGLTHPPTLSPSFRPTTSPTIAPSVTPTYGAPTVPPFPTPQPSQMPTVQGFSYGPTYGPTISTPPVSAVFSPPATVLPTSPVSATLSTPALVS